MDEQRLRDLGERRIIEELLRPRYAGVATSFGDDCALIALPGPGQLVVTTDPCPEPMAALIGFEDLYYRGWLLGTINLSDLAAAGATPLGLVTSLILPAELPVAHFVRLLDGIDDCCHSVETSVVGGNLKEGPRTEVQATAFGVVDGIPLSRSGCQPGDVVAVIGPVGCFWAGALAVRAGLEIEDSMREELLATVLTPRPQVRAGRALRRAGVLSAAIDNSDGLGPSLGALAASSDVGIVLELADVTFPPSVSLVARLLHVDPSRLLFGWGDWQLVAGVPVSKIEEARSIVEALGETLTVVGEVVSGSGVTLRAGTSAVRLTAPDSERFTAGSWFTAGIDAYISELLVAPLTEVTQREL